MDQNLFEPDQVNLNETLRNFVNLSEPAVSQSKSEWGRVNLGETNE